jgi:hypothetical protein
MATISQGVTTYTPPTSLPTSSLQESTELQAIRDMLASKSDINMAVLVLMVSAVSIKAVTEQSKTIMADVANQASKLETANKLKASIAAINADRTKAKMGDDKQFGAGSAQLISDMKSIPGMLSDDDVKKYEALVIGNGKDELGNDLIRGNGLTKGDMDALAAKVTTFQDAASTQSQTANMKLNQLNNQLNQLTSLFTTALGTIAQAMKTAAGG